MAPGATFIGAAIAGPISDYLGRKIALLIAIIGATCFGLVTAFVPSWQLFIFIFGMIHIFNHIGYVAVCVYAVEILGPSKRHLSMGRTFNLV